MGYYGLSAKNIKNSSLFIIQNLFSSYSYNKELNLYVLRNNLHSNQSEIISYINQSIIQLNKKAKAKFNKLSEEDKSKKKLVLFNSYSEFIDSKIYYQILDKSLLENTIKAKELNSEYKDYSIVHSHLAQSVLQKVCDEYQNYYKALKSYKSEKDSFTGKLQEPSYKAKNSAISFDISIQRFTDKGTVLQIGKEHKVYKDYAKTEIISQDLIKQFNSFNLLEVINQDIKNKNLTGNIVGIRVIPDKFNRKSKVEYILSFEKELKGFYPDLLDKSLKKKNKDFFKLKDKEKLALIKDYFNQQGKEVPYFMGIDLGVVNFAAVSIYNQNRDLNYIVSGKSLKNKIINIDSKIDKTKVELCSSNIKSIISKKDKQEQLTREELRLLKEFYRDLSVNVNLVKYQLRKTDITNDFLHKLSKTLICDAKDKEIKVIIVGKNKGWKQEINNGRNNNRAMYNFPHARFIEILKYKAMLNDILVIETEESYTSKTSFIDNEELKVYAETTQGTKNQLFGKRINQIFITKDKIKIHADVNGSFNIVRKVLKSFHYDKKKITLSYNLVELNLSGKSKVRIFNKSRKALWTSGKVLT